MTRFIFVTGGVLSSLGKGLASASLAAVLQARGYKVRLRKLDPYLNVDPGTMSPSQHGEVFVTNDGAETDLDLGHYERFTGVNGRKSDAITTGKVYQDVIRRERRGEYLGATVQVVPHVIDRIKEYILDDVDEDLDFLICEIGGTVGDIEGLPFLEAIRQVRNDLGYGKVMFVHLTLVPYIATSKELKTKPTQHSVKELLSVGIQPDLLLCRCDRELPENERRKLALFCNLKPEQVMEARDVESIYQVPASYSAQGLDAQVLKHFDLESKGVADLSKWKEIVDHINNPRHEVNIAIVGKYMELYDAYKSVYEALGHGGIPSSIRVVYHRIDSETLEDGKGNALPPADIAEKLKDMDAVLAPGGYGSRGTSGIMAAIQHCRETGTPYFGICYGMQLAVVEFARNVVGMENANTSEMEPSLENPLVGLITEWSKDGKVETRDENSDMGGTMRLGAYACNLKPGTLAHRVYKSDVIHERHRHRYEVNIAYRGQLEDKGLTFSGMSPDDKLPEMVEIKGHPWFLAMQFHPEFKSRPFAPSPVFQAFVEAALEAKNKKQNVA